MTSEIQQNRYDRLIRRVAGIIGPGSKVAEVITELFPMIDVERVPGELLLLGGTGIAHGGGIIVCAVGEGCTAQLFNPVDSGNLVTISRVSVAFRALATVRWGTTENVRGTHIFTQIFRDMRQKLPTLPVAQVRQVAEVALASGTNSSSVIADTPFLLQDENSVAVLAPGTGFEIGSFTGINTMFYSFYWRERPAEPSELSL